MEISLSHVSDSPITETFRVAFHSSTERCLLPYPNITGLTFTDAHGKIVAQWRTRFLITVPLDDFVLDPDARIAFDLYANINGSYDQARWMIDLPTGTYNVHFAYRVDRDTKWYDFLAKRSRFAALTPIWRGEVQSNTIPFTVSADHTKNAG
ncbi:hypothetical protein C5Y96_01890 [Blastopirellula marina]|uniref:Uncharacterized protein n=1 Tax=Blastopirellula marina TaxID=124 RepID=A0A2S8G799_9BACT|nr:MULTISPECIES: hypothetical protein [Pirellulaceae]PQO40345.1 hypothetical protein C5Y96_01890 [Blastopirellula marina]RCS55894.1 hypothetical protein DTL36_01895 [Bremerella cremea]